MITIYKAKKGHLLTDSLTSVKWPPSASYLNEITRILDKRAKFSVTLIWTNKTGVL